MSFAKEDKSMKKLLGILLALLLCIALLPSALADGGMEDWTDYTDTSWYSDGETVFHISNAEELAGLAKLVNDGNTFNGSTVYLDADLDLGGREWTSIGYGNNVKNYWGGVFDGQGHTISRLYSHSSEPNVTSDHGLFGTISADGVVRSLSVTDADIYSFDNYLRMGILADWANTGVIENCHTSGTIHNASGSKLVGGVVGTCTAGSQVIGCSSTAKIISDYYDNGDEYSDCDVVGGIVGQWENSTAASLISDCWFSGSIECGFIDSAVGGILGANFDFYGEPGVGVVNCLVATKEIRCAEPGNITWIGALAADTVRNCFWPDSPPENVTLDPGVYPDYDGTYIAVAMLVVDWSAGTAGLDPSFDQSVCGRAVRDFTETDVLAALQENAAAGVEWVRGLEHPVFSWQYVEASTLSLSETELELYPRETAALTALILPADATDKNVTWTSSDPEVASVDENGLVTAHKPGEAVITASHYDGPSAECLVRVTYQINVPDIYDINVIQSVGGAVSVSLPNASEGAVITVTAKPDEGYVLAYVTVDGQRISGSSFTMPGHAVTVSAVFVRAGLPFTDVAYGDWFYDEVAYVYANGLMEGVSDTAFEPGGGMTRAMVWAILARIDGVIVTGSNWAETARSWAMAKGISDGENASAPVTREQLVTMLYRYAGEPVVSGSLTGWADAASVSGWAGSAMTWAVNRGIITGAAESTLAPADGATRAQCAAILMRYIEA